MILNFIFKNLLQQNILLHFSYCSQLSRIYAILLQIRFRLPISAKNLFAIPKYFCLKDPYWKLVTYSKIKRLVNQLLVFLFQFHILLQSFCQYSGMILSFHCPFFTFQRQKIRGYLFFFLCEKSVRPNIIIYLR